MTLDPAPSRAPQKPGGEGPAPGQNRLSPRILFCLRGDGNRASSRVRGYWIADELERLGVPCTVHVARTKADYLRCATLIPRHDVVVFQKRHSSYDALLMRLANRLGRKAYYDIDDAPRAKGLRRAGTMMRIADGVLAGSKNLVELAKGYNARTYLVPSGIKLANYPQPMPRPASARLCLGWIGNGADYAEDLLTILSSPLRTLAERHPLRLKIVGACGNRALHEAFAAIPGLEAELIDQIEWSSPGAAAQAMADFDVGLYPLLNTDFNRYKCGFKALEYMARGIPVVASDIEGNRDVVSDGIDGLLASGAEQWVDGIDRLLGDAALRARFGAAGRRKIESDFSTQRLAVRLLEHFTSDTAQSRTVRVGSSLEPGV